MVLFTMESLSDTQWDVVISGTGLQQSLLALALSRSDKKILHVDTNGYYGGPEAAFSLQEVEEWAEKHQSVDGPGLFCAAQVQKQLSGPAASRSYSLALAPQFIHARSELVSQLVSSKAFRQIEFLSVGSFYIYQNQSEAMPQPSLSRIPSTREDVFSNSTIPAKSKRALMKFLKFVLDYESEAQHEVWKPVANIRLTDFLATEFKLDSTLQSYVVTLTLSSDGRITVEAGLAAISRHLKSMGTFGAGFAAVYPKWGGLSEVAQVGCRAAAVGGAVYMLGTGVDDASTAESKDDVGNDQLQVTLASGDVVTTKLLFQGSEDTVIGQRSMSRLTAVVASPLASLFEPSVEGAPTPAVAVVAFPSGTLQSSGGPSFEFPIYAVIHSSDTGECPNGQCVVYLSTIAEAKSKSLLESALTALLIAESSGQSSEYVYQLYYEQRSDAGTLTVEGNVVTFPCPSLALAFDDGMLEPVRQAWSTVSRPEDEGDNAFMQFADREKLDDDDDIYDN
ncbi:Rab proteins geranylgeranyltransferase component A [Paramyrothecium foliicola]|nr:Rab proteins geranylgeranyltransferase component A [Paramyrothecium foliicola]